jgi:hypothetical protein
MMSIPFFLVAAAMAAIWSGYRQAAVVLCAAGLVTLLVLFRLHATDTLSLVF